MSPLLKYLLPVLAVTFAACAYGDDDQRSFSGKAIYKDAKRASILKLDGGYIIGGSAAERPNVKNVLAGETLGTAAMDCSNHEYRCIEFSPYVLAIPRKKLSDHERYVVKGTVFSVTSCLRVSAGQCDAALIEANCVARDVEREVCLPNATDATLDGPKTYFIYDADFGVTSFGFANAPVAQSRQLDLAKGFLLVSDRGMLSP